jgi:hypothetical protein
LTVGEFHHIFSNLMEDFSLFTYQGRALWCWKTLRRVFNPLVGYCIIFALIPSCQPVDSGARTVVRPQFYPDPTTFGTTIHPLMQAKCGSAACHGRPTTFRLHEAADPLPATPEIENPRLLPEPFRSDYVSVLYFVDLDLPADSELLRFGTGSERAHPGGAVLSDEEAATILNWLESDGIAP